MHTTGLAWQLVLHQRATHLFLFVEPGSLLLTDSTVGMWLHVNTGAMEFPVRLTRKKNTFHVLKDGGESIGKMVYLSQFFLYFPLSLGSCVSPLADIGHPLFYQPWLQIRFQKSRL